MSELLITCGHEEHLVALAWASEWQEQWSPSDEGLDVRVFWRGIGSGFEIELEVSNCSLVVGDSKKSKPRIEAHVSVEHDGEEVSLVFPTDWPMGRGTFRRFVLGTRDPGINFTDDWRQRSKTYGPCRLPLPTFGPQQRSLMVSRDNTSLIAVRTARSFNGPVKVEDSSDCVTPFPGGWWVHGPYDPDEVAGSGIYWLQGYRNSKPDLRRSYLLMQAEFERDRRWYRRSDGEPISTSDYPGISPDVWAYGAPPEALIQANGGDPLPPQYGHAHMVRGLRRTAQVAEQTGSPIASLALAARAGLERMRFTHRGRPAIPGYIPKNLSVLMAQATAQPNSGIYGSIAGRQLGWPFLFNAWSAKVSGWDPEAEDWANYSLDFIEKSTPSAGPIQKCMGEPGGWPDTNFATQAFECCILAYGVAALAIQLGRPIPIFVHRIAENIYGPNTLLPLMAYGGSKGPPHYIRTAAMDGTPVERLQDPLSEYGDPAHALSMIALAASIDPQPLTWVKRGALYGASFAEDEWRGKLDWLTSAQAPDNLHWEAAWIAQAQRVE